MSAGTRLLSIGSVLSATIGGSLLHPLVTGATSSTTHQGAPIGVGLVPAAATFIALAVLLGLVAYAPATVARLVRSTGSTMRHLAPRPSSFMAVAAVGLLVSAAALGGALGPDAQQVAHSTSPVDEAQAIACGGVCIGVGVGIAVGFAGGYIANEYLSGDSTDDAAVKAESWETHHDLSVTAVTVAESQVVLDTVMSNQVNDGSQSVAYAKAKAAGIKAMNDNATEQEVHDNVTNAIQEHYTSMQVNALDSKSDATEKMLYLNDVYKSDPGLSDELIGKDSAAAWGLRTEYGDYQLINGSQHNVTLASGPDDVETYGVYRSSKLSNITGPGYDGTWSLSMTLESNVTGPAPDRYHYSGDRYFWLHNGDSQQLFTDIDNQYSAINSSMSTWVDNTYPGYTAGEINESDILDPVTLSQEFATDYNSTGYYAYAAGDLALQGTNGTLNHSMVFDLHNGSAGRTSNVTLNGTLFTDWEPSVTNGTWETAQTYNASNSGSLVYVATNDGIRVVEGEFHIPNMTNVKTGEAVNNTTLENYNRQTADTGWNESEYSQMLELRQKIDDTQAAAAGGSGNSDMLLLLAGLAGALALLARREGK